MVGRAAAVQLAAQYALRWHPHSLRPLSIWVYNVHMLFQWKLSVLMSTPWNVLLCSM